MEKIKVAQKAYLRLLTDTYNLFEKKKGRDSVRFYTDTVIITSRSMRMVMVAEGSER